MTRRPLFILITILVVGLSVRTTAQPVALQKSDSNVSQRVILVEEDPKNPKGRRYTGTVSWRTEPVSPGPGLAPELAVRADIEIPERRIGLTWSLRPNSDKKLQASHTVEVVFIVDPDFSEGGVASVPGVLMKDSEQARGVPLAGMPVKVTNGFFVIGLSEEAKQQSNNLRLLEKRAWLDIPIVYANGRRALLEVEKGASGRRTFAEAFAAWSTGTVPRQKPEAISDTQTPREAPIAKNQKIDEHAPLGLIWGATTQQTRELGIELKAIDNKDYGQSYFATKLPRALSDQETTILSFGFDDKLFRAVIVSRAYENDPTGGVTRARYSDLSQSLVEKYGNGVTMHRLGTTYKDDANFLAGIQNGQNSWYTTFDTAQLLLQLSVIANSGSTGRWQIIYEQKPLRSSFEEARRLREKGAL